MSKVFLLEKSKTLKTNLRNGINLCQKKKSKANLQKHPFSNLRVKTAMPGVDIGCSSSPSSAINFASYFSSGLEINI